MGRNQPSSFMKLIGVPPARPMRLLTRPERGESRTKSMPTTTTVEMKAGENRTVWMKAFRRREPILLMSRARMIGTGKPKTRPRTLMAMVLKKTRVNWKEWRKREMCSSPTHSLPMKPSMGL